MIRFTLAFAAWLAALPAWAGIEIQQITSPKGIQAWLVEEHSIPFTALQVNFKGGTSLDAPGTRGAIYLMSALLEEGAGDLDARAYARALEALAASFNFGASDDSVGVSARFLTENRDDAIALLRDTIHTPRFDQDAIERVRAQVISSLMSDAKNPRDIAGEAFARMAYGDHPYATDGKGTIDSVSALTRDDILAAHRAVFARDRMYVSAVGDITPAELGILIDTLLADLPATGAPMPPQATVAIPGGVTVIDYDTPQSVAVFGQKGIDRFDKDFFAAFVMNRILGSGGFESRLMHEVREKRGLTYGVYSYLANNDLASLYLGSVSSSNDTIAQAIQVIRDEWARMAEKGVTQKELDDAKTYLTGAYPLRFDGNGQIASILAGMQLQGLPADYVIHRNDMVNAVTLDDVNRVARDLLDPEHLHFIVVGKPEGLESGAGN